MYLGDTFPKFFLPIGRVFGEEIPVTRRGKPDGAILMMGQFKRMTPELERELVGFLADMLVSDLLAHPAHERGLDEKPAQPTSKKSRYRRPRPGSWESAP